LLDKNLKKGGKVACNKNRELPETNKWVQFYLNIRKQDRPNKKRQLSDQSVM